MRWQVFQDIRSEIVEPPSSKPPTGLRLMMDQFRPIHREGWCTIPVAAEMDLQVRSWSLEQGQSLRHLLRFLRGADIPASSLQPERLYLCIEMQRKRLPFPYLSVLDALDQLAPCLEDSAFLLKEARQDQLDVLKIEGGQLFLMRHPCPQDSEDALLEAYDQLALQYPEEEQWVDFVALRHMRIAADFIDMLFERYGQGLPLEGELPSALEVALQMIASNLRQAALHTPEAVDVWHQWARFAIWLADPDTIKIAFDKVYDLDPNEPWAHFDHAVYLWQQGELKEAIEHHRHFVAAEPEEPLALLFAGFLYTKEQMHEEAQMTWAALTQQAETLLSDISRLKDLQRPEYAAEVLNLWLQHAHHFLEPTSHAFAYLDAVMMLQKWSPWEQLSSTHQRLLHQWLEKALLLHPTSDELWLQYARLLRKQGHHEETRTALLRALDSAPRRPELLYMLGQVEAELERFDDAVTHLRRLLALQPEEQEGYQQDLYRAQLAAVLESQAQRLWSEDDLAGAEECYNQILEAYAGYFTPPGMETPWLQKGRLRLKEQKLGVALASVRKALEIHPSSVEGNTLTAYILAQMDRFREATPHIERALSQAPHDPFARYTQACIFAMTGRRHEALHLLQDALQDDPSLREQAAEETLLQRLHALQNFWEILNIPAQPPST